MKNYLYKPLIRLSLHFFVLLLFGWYLFFIPVSASETVSGQLPEQSMIISLSAPAGYDYDLTNLPSFEVVRNADNHDTSYYFLMRDLQQISAQAQTPDGVNETLLLDVSWDATDYSNNPVDQTTVGTYTVTGTIQFPADFLVLESVPRTLQFSVHVYEPSEKIPIISFLSEDYWDHCAYAVECGSELASWIFEKNPTWECYDTEGGAHYAPLIWNTDSIDLNTPGTYTILPDFTSPYECVFSEDLEYPDLPLTISVQSPGQPDINCLYATRSNLRFPWVMPSGDPEKICAFLSTDNQTWTEISYQADWFYNTEEFVLKFLCLQKYESDTFYLQIDYDGGQTGIACFSFDPQISMISYNYGDRDGGDTDGTPDDTPPITGSLPDASDPGIDSNDPADDSSDFSESESAAADLPPQPDSMQPESCEPVPSETSSQLPQTLPAASDPALPALPNNPVQEETQTETLPQTEEDEILGKTLLQMLAASGSARFSGDDISVIFTAASMEALQIQNNDIFRIIIKSEGDHAFSVTVTRNGQILSDFNDLKLQVPFQTESVSPVLNLYSKDQQLLCQGDYAPGQQLAVFTVNQTGSFIISEDCIPEESAEEFVEESVEESAAVSDSEPELTSTKDNKKTILSILFILLLLSVTCLCTKRIWRNKE